MHEATQLKVPDRKHGRAWVLPIARVGYVARGFVYATVGMLALMAVLGIGGGETTDATGAMQAIAQQPLGRVVLGAVSLGLLAFALWRLVETFADPMRLGRSWRGLIKRATYLAGGLIYITFAVIAAMIVLRTGGMEHSDGEEEAREWTAGVLALPMGGWLVGALGLGFVGFGLYELYRAFTADLDEELDLSNMSRTVRRAIHGLGFTGITAFGIVFGLIGGFLVYAAVMHDSDEARGLGGTFDAIGEQPFGPWLLGAMALGFVAYGIFDALQGILWRIDFDQGEQGKA